MIRSKGRTSNYLLLGYYPGLPGTKGGRTGCGTLALRKLARRQPGWELVLGVLYNQYNIVPTYTFGESGGVGETVESIPSCDYSGH